MQDWKRWGIPIAALIVLIAPSFLLPLWLNQDVPRETVQTLGSRVSQDATIVQLAQAFEREGAGALDEARIRYQVAVNATNPLLREAARAGLARVAAKQADPTWRFVHELQVWALLVRTAVPVLVLVLLAGWVLLVSTHRLRRHAGFPIIRRRSQERRESDFVGRTEQITLFRQNLDLKMNDANRRRIFTVSGQEGVGKTRLIKEFQRVALEKDALAAAVDEAVEGPPAAMGRIAEQLAEQQTFPSFEPRYRVYQQKRKELAPDPEAPSGLAATTGKAVAKIALNLAGEIPIAGALVGAMDRDAVATQAGEWAQYVARKLKNQDDLQLMLEPVKVLTPLFLADLRALAKGENLVLLFDGYERTGEFLDQWLRDLLSSTYGETPGGLIAVIAGSQELDAGHWSSLDAGIVRVALDAWTEDDVRQYLRGRGLVDPQVVARIFEASRGLPLLVAALAQARPSTADDVGDPSTIAVERLFQHVDDTAHRRAALDAALPRFLDEDVVARVAPNADAEALFRWLRGMPFVVEQNRRWVYKPRERELTLHHKRRMSPQGWTDVHDRLADMYEATAGKIGLDDRAGWKHAGWRGMMREAMYHRLCQSAPRHLSSALSGFLPSLRAGRGSARAWAEAIQQAGRDAEEAEVARWGDRLLAGLDAIEKDQHEQAAAMFTALVDEGTLDARWQPIALNWRGYLLSSGRRYEQALKDLTDAIEAAPDEAEYWTDRGLTYHRMDRYEDALTDLNEALALDPRYQRALVSRGAVFHALTRYDEAAADFTRVLDTTPDNVGILVSRAEAYLGSKRFPEALSDIDRAIALDPQNVFWLSMRLGILARMGDVDEVAATYARVADRASDFVQQSREVILRMPQEERVRQYQQQMGLLGLDPGATQASVDRFVSLLSAGDLETAARALRAEAAAAAGLAHLSHQQPDAALADFNHAVDLDPAHPGYWLKRGEIFASLHQHDKALADIDHALELSPDLVPALMSRARVRMTDQRHGEALADLDRAAALEPRNAALLSLRLVAAVRVGDTAAVAKAYAALADQSLDYARILQTLYTNVPVDQAQRQIQTGLATLGVDPGVMPAQNRVVALAQAGNLEAIARIIRAEAANAQAALAIQNNQDDEALAAYGTAIELDPTLAIYWIRRGELHRRLDHHQMALADFNRALDLEPDNAVALASRGQVYRAMDRPEEALADLDRALAVQPDLAWALFERGELHRRIGRLDEALADFNRALNLDQDNAVTVASRGQLYRAMERPDEALADLNRAIELRPDYKWALERRAELHRQRKAFAHAAADYALLATPEPPDSVYQVILGDLFLEWGHLDEAQAALEKALARGTDYAVFATISLGLIAYRRGQVAQSQTLCEQALARWDSAREVGRLPGFGLLEWKALALLCLDRADEARQALHEAEALRQPGESHDLYLFALLRDAPQPPEGIDEILALLRPAGSGSQQVRQ